MIDCKSGYHIDDLISVSVPAQVAGVALVKIFATFVRNLEVEMGCPLSGSEIVEAFKFVSDKFLEEVVKS